MTISCLELMIELTMRKFVILLELLATLTHILDIEKKIICYTLIFAL